MQDLAEQAHGEPADPRERLDELLQELRVLLPGVELFFAFLLTVPFTSRFSELALENKGVYFVAFIAAAVAAVLIIAPSAMHRIEHGHEDVERLLQLSTRLAVAGTASLAVAILAVIYLITQMIFSPQWGLLAAAGIGVLIGWFWFALPINRRLRSG